MTSERRCKCGRPSTHLECVTIFCCDVCRSAFEDADGYRSAMAGFIELGNRWRLDLCRDCWRALVELRGGDKAAELMAQAGGVDKEHNL